MDCNPLRLNANASISTNFDPDSKSTVVRAVHWENVCELIYFTLAGISMEVSEEQAQNAPPRPVKSSSPIVLSCDPCSKVTFVKALHQANTASSIVSTFAGISIACNALFSKAPLRIFFRFFGSIIFLNFAPDNAFTSVSVVSEISRLRR